MQITPQTLLLLGQGFNAAFMKGFTSVAPDYQMIAMTVPSATSTENYGWMKDIPGMREWIGPRLINNLASQGVSVANRKWEHTIGVMRDHIEDDKLGIYSLVFAQQGEVAAAHPNSLVWQTLLEGFTRKGFDGQPFFDADHPSFDKTGKEISWSNLLPGTGPAWFVADLSQTFRKPMLFQERKKAEFVSKTRPDDDHVFKHGEYLYGVEARYEAAPAFHQLIVGARADLERDSLKAAIQKIGTQYRTDGQKLELKATHLIVGPSLEITARELLLDRVANGADNALSGLVKIHVSASLE